MQSVLSQPFRRYAKFILTLYLFSTLPQTFAKPHDKSCFPAATQLILLIYEAVTLFEPPYE